MAWSVATPIWGLWHLLWFVLIRPWAIAILISVVSTAYLVFRHRRQKQEHSKPKTGHQAVTDPSTLIPDVLKVLPVHSNNGWVLAEVSHGLRVFTRFFPALSFSGLPCLAASTLMEMSPKKALQQVTSSRELANWLEGLSSPPQHLKQSKGTYDDDGDLIRVTLEGQKEEGHLLGRMLVTARRRMAVFAEKYASFLEGLYRLPADLRTETLERVWRVEGDGLCHVLTIPKEPSALPYHWSLLVFTTLKNKGASVGLSIATLVMLPRVDVRQLSSPLAAELCSLREHILMKNLKAYSFSIPQRSLHVSQNVQSATTAPGRKSLVESVDLPKPVKQPAKPVRQVNKRQELSNAVDAKHPERAKTATAPPVSAANHVGTSSQHSISQSSVTTLDSPASDGLSSLSAKYTALAEETVEKILTLSTGTEQDGWVPLGANKDVFMSKKPPQRGEQLNIVRGNGIIRAPPAFIVRVLKNPKFTTRFDEMLRESRFLDEISDGVRIVHLSYKAVWPTAPRDFSLLSVSGQLNDSTWIQIGLSITDPRIPEQKGHVRAHLVVGGYVLVECPDNPDVSEVTYATKVDLKGSVPSFVVNKVTSNQPLCVHHLRTVVESLYAELKQNPQRMREYEKEFPVHKLFAKKASQEPETGEASQETGKASQEPETAAPKSEAPVFRPKATSLTATSLPAIPKAGIVRNSSSSPQLLAAEATLRSRDAKPGPSRKKSRDRHQLPGSREQSLRAEVIENGPTVFPPITETVDDSDLPPESTDQVAPQRTHGSDQEPAPAFTAIKEDGTESRDESENESNGEEEERDEAGAAPNSAESSPNSSPPSLRNNLIVMESIEAYTPEEISSDEAGGTGEGGGEEEEGEDRPAEGEREEEVFSLKRGPSFELKLPPYPTQEIEAEQSSNDSRHQSLTEETITYPRLGSEVDFRTMGNQSAARVLEEVFHASNMDLSNPSVESTGGWRFQGKEKDVIILQKRTPDSPFHSFMGKGIIELPPQEVYDSIRNPQLRFTYDSMLKGLHIVKRIEDGLYILHLHHETTQCFIKQSRDFCILAYERSERNKKMLVGMSIDVPECPPNPSCTRGRIYYSGWVVEPYKINGKIHTEITYLLQTDLGGLPSTLVNFISKRQPLAIAYLRDYLISTSSK